MIATIFIIWLLSVFGYLLGLDHEIKARWFDRHSLIYVHIGNLLGAAILVFGVVLITYVVEGWVFG